MEYANLDGIRIDTYAYPGQDFMNEWVKAIRKEYPRVLLFGETWVNQPGVQAYFQKNRFGFTEKGAWKNAQLSNVTDFQVYFAIKNALTKPSGWSNGLAEIYYVLTQDYMVEKPEKNVIFLDNHDLSRFYGIVEKDMRKFKIGVGSIPISITSTPVARIPSIKLVFKDCPDVLPSIHTLTFLSFEFSNIKYIECSPFQSIFWMEYHKCFSTKEILRRNRRLSHS